MTARLAIIGCGASKLPAPAAARELYTGPLFRAARDDVEARGVRYRIFSALHRLVDPWHVLRPYNVRLDAVLAELDHDCRSRWVGMVTGQLGNWSQGVGWRPEELPIYVSSREPVIVEVHAGRIYAEVIRAAVRQWNGVGDRIQVNEPCAGLQIGERLAWYAERRRARATIPAEGQLGLFAPEAA